MTEPNSILVPPDEPCAFCDYLSGRRPYSIWFRDSLTAGLVTREQRGVSHVLVVPLRHAETILDLSEAESGALMRGIRRAAQAIDWAEHRPGIAIWQNNGIPAHQMIPHLHFHVAGTLPGGGTEWGSVKERSIAETDDIAARLTLAESRHLPSRDEGRLRPEA